MREVVLDTETTGLSPTSGHRIVDIGCVEIERGVLTGRTFQCYINPERDMPFGAFQIHGLSQDFLSTFPVFSQVCDDFLNFIQNAPLIIHNAKFDIPFLNFEFTRLGKNTLTNPVTDTLILAKQKFPGSPASLDALCRKFGIDIQKRTQHGALLDAHLLAQVYPSLRSDRTFQWDRPRMTSSQEYQRSHKAARVFNLDASTLEAYRLLRERLDT